jgi:hypothetical protein
LGYHFLRDFKTFSWSSRGRVKRPLLTLDWGYRYACSIERLDNSTRYDPDLDTRKVCNIRADAPKEGRTYILEKYRCNTEDPVAIWTDLISKYGFTSTPIGQMSVSEDPDCGFIGYCFKHSTSLDKITLPALIARVFTIHLTDIDTWGSPEILSLASQGKFEVWDKLSQEHALPHLTQFIFAQDNREILHTVSIWPPGEIIAARVKFPVTWLIEGVTDPVIQPDQTSAFTAETACQRLRSSGSRIFEHATFNYIGFLKPSQTITAEVRRGIDVILTVRFEVKDNGYINCEGTQISNMQPRPETHEHFAYIDPRIPPYSEYIDVDDRPYPPSGTITFNLQSGIEITDLSSNSPAEAGGDNGSGIFLPPIIRHHPCPLPTRQWAKFRALGQVKSDAQISPTRSQQIVQMMQCSRSLKLSIVAKRSA